MKQWVSELVISNQAQDEVEAWLHSTIQSHPKWEDKLDVGDGKFGQDCSLPPSHSKFPKMVVNCSSRRVEYEYARIF